MLVVVTLLVGEILVDCRDALVPHALAVLIAKQQRAFQKVFVITVDRAADVTVGVGPLAGLDVDPFADQTDLRATVVCFDERALGLFVKDRFAGEFAQCAKLDDQCSGFGWIADRLLTFPVFS